MKLFIRIFTVMLLINITVSAQTKVTNPTVITDLKAKVENDQVIMNWVATPQNVVSYWEVQGSRDGDEFYAIGLVLGPDPSQEGNKFMFKQKLSKMKSGLKYFRVFEVQGNGSLSFSDMIKTTK